MTRRIRNRPEQALQQACFKYLRYQYPHVLCMHVPNEGTRDPVRGAILKSMGVVAGCPDVMVFAQCYISDREEYCGLAIELKAPKGGKSSDAQQAFQRKLITVGWQVHADIRTFDDFRKIVDAYLKQ